MFFFSFKDKSQKILIIYSYSNLTENLFALKFSNIFVSFKNEFQPVSFAQFRSTWRAASRWCRDGERHSWGRPCWATCRPRSGRAPSGRPTQDTSTSGRQTQGPTASKYSRFYLNVKFNCLIKYLKKKKKCAYEISTTFWRKNQILKW